MKLFVEAKSFLFAFLFSSILIFTQATTTASTSTVDDTEGISEFLVTGDYFVALLEGLRTDDYIDDSLTCAYDVRDT